MSLLYAQLHCGSQAWEAEEQSKLAEKLLRGNVEGIGREFLLTIAAEGRLEKDFFGRVMEVFRHATWWRVLVPDTDRVVSQNAKAFVLLSQQAALVEELLCTTHKQYPFPLFKTLVDDRASLDVVAAPECCRGQFVNDLLSKYGLSDPKLREILLMHCQLCATSIADLESKHASNRRTLVQHSVQTWALQAATLSAE
eukprot:3309654-Amphidinium_carterae.1